MNKIAIVALKSLRKIYTKTLGSKKVKLPVCEQDPDVASKLIYDALMADEPCMIARFGSIELSCIANYLGVLHHKGQYVNYIKGDKNL